MLTRTTVGEPGLVGEAPTLSVGAMASEVGVSRVALAKHIREGRVAADCFQGNRALYRPASALREKFALSLTRVWSCFWLVFDG